MLRLLKRKLRLLIDSLLYWSIFFKLYVQTLTREVSDRSTFQILSKHEGLRLACCGIRSRKSGGTLSRLGRLFEWNGVSG